MACCQSSDHRRYAQFLKHLIAGSESSRKQAAESSLLKKELSAILSLAQESLLVMDPDGRIVELNPAMSILLDMPRTQILGSYIQEWISPADWEHLRAAKDLEERTVVPRKPSHSRSSWKVRVKCVLKKSRAIVCIGKEIGGFCKAT